MKKARNVVLALLCALLLIAGSVAGTLAYLTSQTETVTNTFTAGNVTITMDETDVDEYGVKDGDTRVIENDYTLLPNHLYVKDPTIHVKAGSEACWLFVEIDDQIAAIQDTETVAAQMTANGWKPVEGTTNVFWHEVVNAKEATDDMDVKIFENFKIKGTETNNTLAPYTDKTIVVTAYAVQADGFNTAKAAWDATFKN